MRSSIASLFALLLAGISLGAIVPACTSPMATPSCRATDCTTACVGTGNRSGSCNAAGMCVCQPQPMGGGGDTVVGISSGGVVERTSGTYRVRMAIAPAEAAAGTRSGATREVHLGLEGQTAP